ncbi:MAG: hypothetical protein AAF790_12695 [Planctomycetota bacterium]
MTHGVKHRMGGSLLQVLACLVAIGGGCWLGAQYMGVEVGDIAYTALDETELLDRIPPDWRPSRSDCPSDGCPEPPTEDERAAALIEELNGLRFEAAKLRQAASLDGGVAALIGVAKGDSEAAIQREQTLAYWARLSEIANDVAQLDASLQPAVSRDTTGYVFDLRRRSFDYARRAIEAIPYRKADPQAQEAGQRLAIWYDSGARFYTEATEAWDALAGSGGSRVAEQSLNRSREQHRKESELVRAKLAEINSLLSRRYAAAFTVIGL